MFTRVHDVEQMFGALNLFRHNMDDRFLAGWTTKEWCRAKGSEPKLATNVYDTGDALVMQVEVAGAAKEDLAVELQGKHLTIKGERRKDGPEGYTVHRQDLASRSFSRAYILPLDIAGDKVTSALESGILTLTLPKAEEAKKREITIQ